MSVKIVAPARCEVRAVIRFFCAKRSSAAEIYRELSLVYGPGVMCEGKVRQWCRDFKNGRTNVHDKGRSGRPSVQTDEIVSLVYQKLRSDPRLTISALADELRPKTQEKIEEFRWELFNHPPYSPDLAPSDYFLFLHFKKWLGGQRFENDMELKNAVENWFNSQAASFYAEGLRKLVKRYEKCLEVNGNYVEK
ncbi:hypothetical protein QTP88_017091 [Uroleucon formosanum]